MEKWLKTIIVIGLIAFAPIKAAEPDPIPVPIPEGCCQQCENCFGTYYICRSQYDQFLIDYCNGCGPGSSITLYIYENC